MTDTEFKRMKAKFDKAWAKTATNGEEQDTRIQQARREQPARHVMDIRLAEEELK